MTTRRTFSALAAASRTLVSMSIAGCTMSLSKSVVCKIQGVKRVDVRVAEQRRLTSIARGDAR